MDKVWQELTSLPSTINLADFLKTVSGKLLVAYAGLFLLNQTGNARLATPFRLVNFLAGLPIGLVYAPLRAGFYRYVYPGKPSVPGSPFGFEVSTRLVQFLMGILPDGTMDVLPKGFYEAGAFSERPGTKHLWRVAAKEELPEGLRGVWVEDPALKKGEEDMVVLHLHGGGYCICSPSEYANFGIDLHQELVKRGKKPRVFVLDYDLAPEARFPKQMKQALAAYEYLITKLGVPTSKIVIAGDSAGGNLALILLIHLFSNAHPDLPTPKLGKPAAAVLISPWVRLYSYQESLPATHSMNTNEGRDYVPGEVAIRWGSRYIGPHGKSTDPWISPILFPADVLKTALPEKVLTTAGASELVVDDIVAFHKKVDVGKLIVQEGRVHDYPCLDLSFAMGYNLEEKRLGVRQIADFLAV